MPGSVKVVHLSTVGITATKLLRPQCEFLRELGYEVSFVFSPDQLARQELESAGFRVYETFISRRISVSDVRSVSHLVQHFRWLKPDIVHTHTSKAGVLGRVAARIAGVPHVIHTIHGFPFIEGQNRVKYGLYVSIERWAAKLTDVLLSQSSEDVDSARRLKIKARYGYPIHIGNGIDTRRFDPSRFAGHTDEIRAEIGIRNSPVITIVARQTVEKGYMELIDALTQLADMRWTALFVGGDEGDGKLIRQRIRACGLSDRIVLLGERNDVDRLLAVSDIYVLPSHREGVPRSVIEAQAMGLPAVVTNIRGCREVVQDGITGYMVPPGDAPALASALRSLLLDPGKRISMGTAARRRAEAEFDESRVFERVARSYELLLSR